MHITILHINYDNKDEKNMNNLDTIIKDLDISMKILQISKVRLKKFNIIKYIIDWNYI